MRRFMVILFIVCILGFSATYAYASYVESSIEKAKQGVVNIFTGWLEIPYQASKGFKDGFGENGQNKPLGGFFGIFRGFIHAAGRTAGGVYQVVTFPLPNPKNNDGVGIPLDAKNVWEGGEQYSLVNKGTGPIGKKAFRGVVNSFFSILEVPGQITKGFSEDKPFIGIGKAIVFPIGRFSSGVYDLVTVFLPNNIEGLGYGLEEKYPWDALEKANRRNEQQ
ncbi:MAG: hypothetical protein PHQ96_06690 [Candidatus Omnitrophica bacterium]|nr:hypothetical protein [Candidatus Omnitrophota bacterium]